MARKDNGLTLELPGIARRRGRPCTGNALTGAQRQKAYRARLRAEYLEAQRHPEFPSRVTKNQEWDTLR